jgi:hypothetical protein
MEGFGEGMGMYVRSWEDLDGHVWEACAMLGGPGGCGGENSERAGEGKGESDGKEKGKGEEKAE